MQQLSVYLVSKLATLFGLYLHRVFQYFLKVKESSSGAHTRQVHTRPQTFAHTHTHGKCTTRNMPDRDVTLERDNSSWGFKIEAVQQYSLTSDVNWNEMAIEIKRERQRAKDKERARVPATATSWTHVLEETATRNVATALPAGVFRLCLCRCRCRCRCRFAVCRSRSRSGCGHCACPRRGTHYVMTSLFIDFP